MVVLANPKGVRMQFDVDAVEAAFYGNPTFGGPVDRSTGAVVAFGRAAGPGRKADQRPSLRERSASTSPPHARPRLRRGVARPDGGRASPALPRAHEADGRASGGGAGEAWPRRPLPLRRGPTHPQRRDRERCAHSPRCCSAARVTGTTSRMSGASTGWCVRFRIGLINPKVAGSNAAPLIIEARVCGPSGFRGAMRWEAPWFQRSSFPGGREQAIVAPREPWTKRSRSTKEAAIRDSAKNLSY